MRLIFIIILFIPICSAINISLEYPNEVFNNEEFEIKINTDSIQLYDVKIDIFGNNERISKIFDEKWKSTMYYVKMSLKKNQTYRLTTSNYVGEANITIKLRNYAGGIKTFDGYKLNITEKSLIVDSQSPDEKENEETKKDYKKSEESEKSRKEKDLSFLNKSKKREISKREIMILNPKTIKTNENNSLVDKGYSKYLIIVFCLILIVLYITKPKEKKNEFK